MQRQTRSSAKAAQNGNGVDKNGKMKDPAGSNGYQNGHVLPATAPKEPERGFIFRFAFRSLFPIMLMVWSGNMPILFWYTVVKCNGSYQVLLEHLFRDGLYNGMVEVWSSTTIFSSFAMWVVLAYCVWALLLMVLLPGPRSEGPVTPKGNTPIYKDNGFFCYAVTMVAFFILAVILKQQGSSVTIIYDRFGEFVTFMSIATPIVCIFVALKGLLSPSTSDCGSNGNLIMDYYWGTELYPRVFGIDIKVFTNCRFGLTVWPLMVMIHAFKSYELYGFVDSMWISCVLQMIYLTKFFWWEAGYMRTIDIMVDRAGYYICWGCLCFVPLMYTSVSYYLVSHPIQLGPIWGPIILVAGLVSVSINYIADKQKQDVRRTNGDCLIWGKPAKFIRAKYRLETGENRESLLLVSGWWGVTRHFHYIPELTLAFCWSATGLFENLCLYSYVLILAGILIHRTFRDDVKCGTKYQEHWKEYCRLVPYKMIPGIF